MALSSSVCLRSINQRYDGLFQPVIRTGGQFLLTTAKGGLKARPNHQIALSGGSPSVIHHAAAFQV
jgi:hypothetical protein